jgi:AraC family transcriptional activator of pobA
MLHQFFLLNGGGGTISIDGAEHTLAPPVAITMPAMTVHGFQFVPDTAGWVITLPTAVLNDTMTHAPAMGRILASPAIVTGTPDLDGDFQAVSEEHAGHQPGRNQFLLLTAGRIALAMGRLATRRTTDDPRLETRQAAIMRRFLELLEARYRTSHLVRDYAADLGVTAAHLSRTSRHVTGKSAIVLIQDRLTLEAKRLLVYSRMSVTEMAYELGFSDPAHFSKFFLRQTGLSPLRFRHTAENRAIARE